SSCRSTRPSTTASPTYKLRPGTADQSLFGACPATRANAVPLGRRLATGAEMRVTGSTDRAAVVCVNGGQGSEVEGTWSATLEWLVRRLAPRFPKLGFAEVRYRIKSWKRMDWCVADAWAAIGEAAAPRTILLAFAIGVADHPSVEEVVGLAPWIPERLRLEPLVGRRFAVIQGRLDR